jgi:hypothetical protein
MVRSSLLPVFLAAAFLIAAASALAADATPVHYSLKGLRPHGISQYAVRARTAQREYIHFENEQGNHYLIYEEAPGSPPTQAMKTFRAVMGSWDMVCSLELDCKQPAFCTGSCKNLYYETSNTPEDLGLLDRNHCSLSSYHCEKPPAGATGTGT